MEDVAVIMLESSVGFPTTNLPMPGAKITDMEEIGFAGFGKNDRNVMGNLLEGKALKLPVKYCEIFYDELLNLKNSENGRDPEFIEKVQERLEGFTPTELEEAEQEIPQLICTGLRKMDEKMQFPKKGDSGMGLFKTDDSFTVYGVSSSSNYEGEGYQLMVRQCGSKCQNFSLG